MYWEQKHNLSKYNFGTIFTFLNTMKNRKKIFEDFDSPSEELVDRLIKYL
tara:strand:+ start:361 stop:510 length:150 start_codon:yes stop_codon:yes gene_type:complete